MMKIREVLSENYSTQELLNFVSELCYFNRIQGSMELEEASRYIKDVLSEDGQLDAEIKEYNYSKGYGALHPVSGWWVKYGELRLLKPKKKLLHTYYESRTLVVAHSPGGDVEGEVVHVGSGEEPKDYKADVNGKIVLGYGSPYRFYMEATKRGAIGVLVYRKVGIVDAVPYRGLFLTPDEAKRAKAPVMAVSRSTAQYLIRCIEKKLKPRVRMVVDAGYRDEAYIPVVTTTIGKGNEEIHICAHYCHPAGTVNDNVSGAAAIIELAISLARAINKGEIDAPDKHKIRFLWFPEYWGSMAYLLNEKPNVVFNANLDMIGEKQNITNSTILFIRSPPSLFHPYESIFYYQIRDGISRALPIMSYTKSIGYRFDLLHYSMGSDHDIYLHFGIPAIMINQWPDEFYHTDKDTIDKFDVSLAKNIAVSTGVASYLASCKEHDEILRQYVAAYFLEYLATEASKTNSKLYRRRLRYLAEELGDKVPEQYRDKHLAALMKIKRRKRTIKAKELYQYIGPKGIIITRPLYEKISWAEYKWLNSLILDHSFYRTIIFSLIPLYMRKAMSIREFIEIIKDEFGISLRLKDVKRIMSILVKAGLAKKIEYK